MDINTEGTETMQDYIEHAYPTDLHDEDEDPNWKQNSGLVLAHYLTFLGKQGFASLQSILPQMEYNFLSVSGESVESLLRYSFTEEELPEKLKLELEILRKKPVDQLQAVTSQIFQDKICCRKTFRRYLREYCNEFSTSLLVETYPPSSLRKKALKSSFNADMRVWNGSLDEMKNMVDKYFVGEFHFDEECPDEHCQIAKAVIQRIKQLANVVAQLDPNLSCDVIPIGSTADGSKMFIPDEFDFLLVLRNGEAILEKLKEEDQIRQAYVRIMLEESIKILLQSDDSGDSRLQFLSLELSATNNALTVFFTWRGSKYSHLHLTVDLNVVVRFPMSKSNEFLLSEADLKAGQLRFQEENYFQDCLIPEVDHFTASTLECSLLLSNGSHFSYCYRILKMLFTFITGKLNVSPSTYFVKIILLNHGFKYGPPDNESDLLFYCTQVIYGQLFGTYHLNLFLSSPSAVWLNNRGLHNWCYNNREDIIECLMQWKIVDPEKLASFLISVCDDKAKSEDDPILKFLDSTE